MSRQRILNRQPILTRPWFLTFVVAFLLTIALPSHFSAAQVDDGSAAPEDGCGGLRVLMAGDRTPHDLPAAGGVLSPTVAEAITLEAGQYAAYHILNVGRPENQASTLVSVGFSELTAGASLEVGLFRGLEPVGGDYRTVTTAQTETYTIAQGGLYTLVVRRADLNTLGTAASYTVVADFTGTGEAVPTPLRDETTGTSAQGVTFINGYQLIPLPSAAINIHADGATTVASRDGTVAQIRYGTNGLQVGSWAERIALLGGDLAVTGETTVGGTAQPRILYIQDFGHAVNLTDLNLSMIVDADGNTLNTDWQNVRGVWLLRDCLGMKLHDGRTFIAALTATDAETGEVSPVQGTRPPRIATFSGALADFDIRVNAPTSGRVSAPFTPYIFDLSWEGIAENSEVRLHDGVLSVELLGGKHLDVGDTSISMFRRPENGAVDENTPLEVVARSHDAALLVDWRNMRRLSFTDETLHISFTDARADVTRDGANLMRFESLQDAVRIVEKPTAAGQPGEHRLWLGADTGYIEILTPAGQPDFDNRALPGEAGYFPRALNNLGGECYPTNTLLPEANCPPNGHINPANGNLWYSVADLEAAGGWIDLTLTRSYNLLARDVDGPFGRGWTTAFALDYAVSFDPATQSRRIERDHTHRVGLDLTWTPRGIVTFTTPSGSRHTFVSPAPPAANTPGYEGTDSQAPLTAITMPGWTLTRRNPQDVWMLRQSDGLTYSFDRAGRLTHYGYPDLSRIISVTYNRAALNGQIEGSTAVITDDATQRRLELVYTAEGRIGRAILRDMSIPSAVPPEVGAPCADAVNCQETRYEYDAAGMLARVFYADGQQAEYTYDSEGRMLTHNDPRAPITPMMTYAYDQSGVIESITVGTISTENAQMWRRFILNTTETERRFSVIEPAPPLPDAPTLPDSVSPDRATTYVYTLAETPGPNTPVLPLLRQAGNGYTLKSITGPLAGTGAGIDGEPQTYTWNNGLLTSINARGANENVGRNSITFAYRPDGQIMELGQGVIGFTVRNFDANGLPGRVSYGDLSEVGYEYDAQQRPTKITDRQGAVYSITWDDAVVGDAISGGRPTRLRRENDGFVWTYTYNALGLVTLENRNGHLISYEYDGLGRLVAVDDPLLGRYTLTYGLLSSEQAASFSAEAVASNKTPLYVSEVVMTDQAGVRYIVRYDARGRLVETITAEPGEASPLILRHTTWVYDSFDRVTREIGWAGNDDQPLETTLTYEDTVPRLEPLPGQPNTPENAPIIKGYAVTKTDSLGRTQRYVYDALGRVREVLGDYGRRQRYDYSYDDVAVTSQDVTLPKGLRIRQRDLLGELLYASTIYEYSERWQLREITRTTGTAPQTTHIWSLATQGDPVRPAYTVLEARSMGIASLNWGVGDGGGAGAGDDIPVTDPRATGVTIIPANTTVAGPRHNAGLDFLGRPITVTDGSGITSSVAYCPMPDGNQRVLLFQPAGSSAVQPCQRSNFQYEMIYDAHGRLIQASEANGERGTVRRIFTYTRENTYWKVSATFGAGTGVGRWTQHYNMAGDLIYWLDENGIERIYSTDSAGRLTAVQTDDLPDASYTFTYDSETGLLEQVIDGLDRGWTYQYDTRGLLLSRQQVETANATTYGYDSAGRLTSVISPLGNTTVYRYGDTDDPWRVTEIVDATGVVHRYGWNDRNNTLSYRDIRGRENCYRFDALGTLWMIEEGVSENGAGEGGVSNEESCGHEPGTDADSRITELRYNAAGELTDIAVNPVVTVTGNTRATQHFTISRGAGLGTPVVIGEAGVSDWSWALTFNADGLLTGITDPQGKTLTASYDALRRLMGIDAGAHDWALAYPPDNEMLTISHSLNNRAIEAAQVTYDALYRLTALNRVNPDGGVPADDVTETEYVYTVGRDLSLTYVQRDSDGDGDGDGDGEATERSYTFFPGDNTANPRTVTLMTQGLNESGDGVVTGAPSGQTMTVVYNPENLIEELRHTTCAAGELADCTPDSGAFFTTFTRFLYDAQGRPIRINDAERGLEVFTYDDLGNLISYQTVNGRAFNYEYDSRNRLSTITGPTGIQVLVTYNDLDQVVAVCRARAEEISNFADCERIDSRPDTDVIIEEYEYDSLGRLTAQRFRNGNQNSETTITNTYTGGLLTDWGVPGQARVERAYTDDVLALLRQVRYNSGLTDFYDLNYDLTLLGDVQLTAQEGSGEIPDIAYRYDIFGRLAQMVYGGTAFRLDYQPNRQGYRFTVAERGEGVGDASVGGEGVGFLLNQSGLLAALTYSTSDEANAAGLSAALNFDYTAVQRATDILQIGIGADEGRNFIYELDRQGQTLSQATDFEINTVDGLSVTDSLFVVNRFALNLAGQVNRQQVDGSPPDELFDLESGGYVTVTGYDDNYRLTTVAITSKNDGRPLYTLNFAYNAVGQRESETRRFEDDTQIDITYVYTVSSQLTQRLVEIIRPGQQTTNLINAWPLVALIPLLLLSRLHRRTVYRLPRKVVVIALASGLVGTVMLGSVVWGQQAGGTTGRESFRFDYAYDAAGNLSRISYVPNGQPDAEPTECAVYRYDAANRLVEAQAAGQTVRYGYDVHNRLIRGSLTERSGSSSINPEDMTEEWHVLYAGAMPIAAYSQPDEIVYYGRVDDHPPFFLGQPDGLTWLVSDGRDRILTTVTDSSAAESPDAADTTHPKPILVLDPVGRPLEFAPPSTFNPNPQSELAVGNPCQLSRSSTELSRSSAETGLVHPLPAFDGMLWDPNTNLYFSGGRAYLPEIGRFLQRNTDGPDAFGSVYDFARRPDIPVQRPTHSPLVDGLGLLAEALDTIHLVDSLSPEAVTASYQPAPRLLDDTAVWTDALGGRAPNQDALARLQALPSWLRSAYNLPEPQLDTFAGSVGLPLANAPGQGGVGVSATSVSPPTFPTRSWLPSMPNLPSAIISTAPEPTFARVNSYRSLAWTPGVGLAGWSGAWDVSLPRLDGADTPSAVLEWLPRPLTAPTAPGVMNTLRLIEAIRTLPFETGYDWLVRLLTGALPSLPDLPPLNEADWRAERFDTDTFGLRKALASRYDVPPAPDVPIYGLFPNLDWLRGE